VARVGAVVVRADPVVALADAVVARVSAVVARTDAVVARVSAVVARTDVVRAPVRYALAAAGWGRPTDAGRLVVSTSRGTSPPSPEQPTAAPGDVRRDRAPARRPTLSASSIDVNRGP
jgi:hypothetical protein